MTRAHRLGVCVAWVICGWSMEARAAITMDPNLVVVPAVLVGGTDMATGTLSSTTNGIQAQLVLGTCTGGGGGSFTFSPNANINLNAAKVITVTFTAAAPGGTLTCDVHVNDGGGPTLYTFQVRGTGMTPPNLSVQGSATFPSVRWNDLAPIRTSTQNITVTNTGTQNLTITNVTVTGDFSITTGGTSATLNPTTPSRTWQITFNPSATGTSTGMLTFTSNDADGPISVNLSGIGTNAIIKANDLAFGTVASGSQSSRDLLVENVGLATKGPLGVTSATIANGNGWFVFSVCGGGNATSCTFSPPGSVLNSGTVGIKCSPPANSTATQTADITFVSDSDPGAVASATLSCTGGASSLKVSSASITFANQLVNTTSAVQTVTITNEGTSNAVLFFRRNGTGASAFTVTAPNNCGASSGGPYCNIPFSAGSNTMTFDVTFTPPIEGDISSGLELLPNTGNAVFPQLSLAGRGIDRHIMVTDSVLFPDTFRNPGAKAVPVPIAVNNIGEYPLHIESLGVSGEPVWALAEPFVPFDVPGLGSTDVMVKFLPLMPGKAPTGTLVITSDDRVTPTSTIILDGNGKDRNVVAAPITIEFGEVGVGVATRLSDVKPENLLVVENMEAEPFTIRELKYEGDDVFEVRHMGGSPLIELRAGSSNTFDVVVTPTSVGEFSGYLVLYLDDDMSPQVSVPIRGRALWVSAGGGGGFGCSTSGGGGGLVIALGALLLRRRRRHA